MYNPFTGRKIKEGGPTHKKLLKLQGELKKEMRRPTLPERQNGGGQGETQETADFYKSLLSKAKNVKYGPKKGAKDTHTPSTIPKSKYHLISSNLPPAPEEHSWQHHHAPFSQNFGDYVCLKKSVLSELGMFLRDALTADIHEKA